jgi:hypothetical protein
VPIRGFIKGTDKFPIQKCAIFRKFKEIKELRGGILLYAAQAIPPIDAEIAEKGHLWTETRGGCMRIFMHGIFDLHSARFPVQAKIDHRKPLIFEHFRQLFF